MNKINFNLLVVIVALGGVFLALLPYGVVFDYDITPFEDDIDELCMGDTVEREVAGGVYRQKVSELYVRMFKIGGVGLSVALVCGVYLFFVSVKEEYVYIVDPTKQEEVDEERC